MNFTSIIPRQRRFGRWRPWAWLLGLGLVLALEGRALTGRNPAFGEVTPGAEGPPLGSISSPSGPGAGLTERGARARGGIEEVLRLAQGVSTTAFRVQPASEAAPKTVDAASLAEHLIDSLGAGYRNTTTELRRLGLTGVVEDISRLDGLQLPEIESEELLREIYRRAEAHTAGQGERVLAYLYQEQAKRYPAVAEDPAFEALRGVLHSTGPPLLDPAQFKFAAGTSVDAVRLTSALESAVQKLAYAYSTSGNLSQLNRLATLAFGWSEPRMSRYLAQSRSVREALTRAVAAHMPPPSPEEVVLDLMDGTLQVSEATRGDAEFLRAVRRLEAEVGLHNLDDPALRGYVEAEESLPTRVAQAEEAARHGLPGRVSPTPALTTRTIAEQWSTESAVSRKEGPVSFGRAVQNYANYVSVSFEPPAEEGPDAMSHGSGGAGGGGGGGGLSKSSSVRSYRTTPPPPSYRSRAGVDGGGPRVPRSFSRAVVSARGARGIAVGGSTTYPSETALVRTAWLPNREDRRFGKILAEVRARGSTNSSYVASRTLFADSFLVATDALFGGHYGASAFVEGEVLVLMSMDPFDTVDAAASGELEKKSAALSARVDAVGENDFAAQLRLLREMMELERLAGKLPRRIVTHPSLFGRELAWSAVRIDFSFNDLKGLSREAAATNGGQEMPANLADIEVEEASTWQFYELPASIMIETETGRCGRLVVASEKTFNRAARFRSHFGVSMFALDPDADVGMEGRRLPELERQVQRLLDWLSTNHHDYIRLNDFAESFALLRWARKHHVTPWVLDLAGPPIEIGTPDRVVIGSGPKMP